MSYRPHRDQMPPWHGFHPRRLGKHGAMQLSQQIMAKAFMLELSQQGQQVLLETMASHFIHVVAPQANAFLEVHIASFIPRKAEHEHERQNRKQAAAMTTNMAIDEDAFLAQKKLHQK